MAARLEGIGYADLTEAAYASLLQHAEVLLAEPAGPKVCRIPNGEVVKFFFRRGLLSSNLWCPYAWRFARNSLALARLDIAAVPVCAWGRVPHLRQHYVRYAFLEGTTLRSALAGATDAEQADLVALLAAFFARLHESGVLFRAGHLGNFILRDDRSLALIDLENLQIRRSPLALGLRVRNFGHLLRYPVDRALLWERYRELFWRQYSARTHLGAESAKRLWRRLENRFPAP
jgi:hypothetical protein